MIFFGHVHEFLEWYKRFSQRWEKVEYDERSNRPVTARTEDVLKISKIVRKDRRLIIKMTTYMLHSKTEAVI